MHTHHIYKEWADRLEEKPKLLVLSTYDIPNFARLYKLYNTNEDVSGKQ